MLVGSGQRVNTRKQDNEFIKRTEMPWQRQALALYDLVPELHFAGQFYARMLSKVRLFPAKQSSNSEHPEPIESGPPVDILQQIQDPGGGHSQLLFRYGQLMFITGDGFLLGKGIDQGPGSWTFVWRDELRFEKGVVTHLLAPNLPPQDYADLAEQAYTPVRPGSAVAYRMWTPHPRASAWPDSPMRACLDIGEELLILTKSVHSTATSRLARAPMLKVPIELMPPPVDAEGDEDPDNDPFQQDLTDYVQYAIQNPSDASASAPFIFWGAYDYIDRVDTIKLHDPQTDYVERDLRAEAVKRLGYSLDMPPEALTGFTQSNHWCTDEETEILTYDRGFVHHADLQIGDLVRTLNTTTGLAEWQPVKDIYRAEVVDEPMVEMKNTFHSSLTTLNHRWPVIKQSGKLIWTTSENLCVTDSVVIGAEQDALPEEPVYSDQFVETVAWFVTEGTTTWPSPSYCQMKIAQSHLANPDYVVNIRSCLTRLWGEDSRSLLHAHAGGAQVAPAWREDAEERGMTLFHLNARARDEIEAVMEDLRSKVISRKFIYSLTRSQLELLLQVAATGDGDIRPGRMSINQRSRRRLEPLALAAVLAGRSIRWLSRLTGGFGPPKLQWELSIHRPTRRITQPAKYASQVNYTGTIWCPVTDNQTWFAQRDGSVYFTGNSAAAIMDAIWNDHGDPKMKQFCHDVADMYLRPALRDEGYKDWENVTLWYDATEVVMNPDRSDDANEAWDRGAIGYTGFRKMKSIPESYKQTPEEHQEWLEQKLVRIRETQEKPSQAERNPARGPTGSPENVVDIREGKKAVAASGRELGAAELALLRCREMAGIRLRRLKGCPSCLEAAAGQPAAMVASLVGPEGVQQLGVTNTRDLVKDGGDQYRALLSSWGYPPAVAEVLSQMVEAHAARTLFEQHLPSMPAGFAAHVERTKEDL